MAQVVNRIKSGPSLLHLVLSLIVGSLREKNRYFVTFQLASGSDGKILFTIRVRIEGLMREDGSGERWLFTGFQEYSNGTCKRVKGYYNCQHRIGSMELINT